MLAFPLRLQARTRDLVTVALGAWLMIGLFVDGWAHNNLTELETFWTPWHALFYSGFTATAGWIVWNVVATRSAGQAAPPGYGLSTIGVGIFAIGGVGDAIWHSMLGIETDVDALFSPTHLLLFAGIALILTTPLRSTAARTSGAVRVRDFLPAAGGLALLVSLLQFFFMYASGLTNGTLGFPWQPGADDLVMVYGVLAMLTTTVIVFGPLLWAVRRWVLPIGTHTVVLAPLAVLMSAVFGFERPVAMVAPIATGILLDATHRASRPHGDVLRTRIYALTSPMTLWTLHIAVFAWSGNVGWPIEVWAGTIIWTGLAGLGLALVATERQPADRTVQSGVGVASES